MTTVQSRSFVQGLSEQGGEAGRLVALIDWSRTSLGPIDAWPKSLQTMISVLLRSPIPMLLLWGEDGVALHNDGWAAIVEEGTPHRMGTKVSEAPPEVAALAGPALHAALAGSTLSFRIQPPTRLHFSTAEQAFVDVDCSPVPGDDGQPAGALCVATETTGSHYSKLALARSKELRESEARYRQIVEGANDFAIVTMDAHGTITGWNSGAERIVGFPREEALGQPAAMFFTPEDRKAGVPDDEMAHAASDERALDERWHLRRDGTRFWASGLMMRLEGEGSSFLKMFRDRTSEHQAEAALRASEARLHALAAASSEVLYRMSPDWEEMRELSGGRFLASTKGHSRSWLLDYIDPEDQPTVLAAVERAIETKSPFELEHRVRRADGTLGWTHSRAVPVLDDAGRIVEWFGAASDVTARREAEQRLWDSAHVDELSGLANRSWFQARITEWGGVQVQGGRRFVLLLVDLDEFKDINDTWGHQAGDQVIRVAAERLRACAHEGAFLARLGGDEFAILIEGDLSVAEVAHLAERIQSSVRAPVPHQGSSIVVSASIGVAFFPQDATSADRLVQCADMALYAVKRSGRGTFGFFAHDMQSTLDARRSAIDRVRQAAQAGRLVAHYQPKIRLSDGSVCGLEALVRIVEPDGMVVGPGSFWPALEDAESVRLIDDQVLAAVTRDLAPDGVLGHDFGPVSINVSEHSLQRPNFADRLLAKLRETGTPSSMIEVEVLETVLLGRSTSKLAETFQALHDNGVFTALDDFGTGFASLAHLRDLPIQRLKLDRSFVLDVKAGAQNASIVSAIIGLAQALGIKTVAEGIETSAAREALSALGCDEGQGFLFGAAVSGTDLRERLRPASASA